MKPNWEGQKTITVGTGNMDTIHNSKPGYTLSFLKDLTQLPGNIDVKTKLMEMLKGERHPESTETIIPKDEDRFKAEIYEITAFGIEEVWTLVNYFFQENKGLLEEDIFFEDTLETKVLTDIEAKQRFAMSGSLAEIFYLIRHLTRSYLTSAINAWQIIKEQSVDSPMSTNDPLLVKSNMAYKRLSQLLKEGKHATQRDVDEVKSETPAEHIMAGLNTGENLILNIQRVVIEVFEKQFNRQPTATEFKELSISARSLILLISSVNNSIFPILMDNLRVYGRNVSDNPLDSEFFSISEENGKKKLEIKFEVLAKILTEVINVKFDKSTMKCPALLTPGQNGKNVIAEMYDWYEGLTVKHILPELQRLRDLHNSTN